MDCYGEIVNVDDNYQQIGIGEVGVSSSSAPILLTKEIQTCVAILLITKECASLVHINFGDSKNYSKGLSDVVELLKKYNGKIFKFQMFLGSKTLPSDAEKLKNLFRDNELHIEVYRSYLDGDMGSIAYNFKEDKYYGVDIDNNFRPYFLGEENKKSILTLEELMNKSL